MKEMNGMTTKKNKKVKMDAETLIFYFIASMMFAVGIVAMFGGLIGVAVFEVVGSIASGAVIALTGIIWTILIFLRINK